MGRAAASASALAAALGMAGVLAGAAVSPDEREVTLVHIGDLHSRLVPREDALAAAPRTVGGVARIHTIVERIRSRSRGVLVLNSGDTMQGSAEALFTRGEAIAEVVDALGIDAWVPGNWDFAWGATRFRELVTAGRAPRWGAVAANLYERARDGSAGDRVLPAFVVREAGGVRVGIVGLTTRRGPKGGAAEGAGAFVFTDGERELAPIVRALRDSARVDVVVLLSELELPVAQRLVERVAGIDVVLSADMHERTPRPLRAATGTLLVEEGADGASVGELALRVRDRRVVRWRWTQHDVSDDVPESPSVAALVARVRAPFLDPAAARRMRNPVHGAALAGPLDEVVGFTSAPLHRASTAEVPAVIAGPAHDFITDALRAESGADIAILRGHRFGTQLRAGPITRGDIYSWLPVGAQAAVVEGVRGAEIVRALAAAADGAIDPDPVRWTGGWATAVSGLTYAIDPARPAGARVRDVRVHGAPIDTSGARLYSVVGLWYPGEPDVIAGCARCGSGPRLLRAADGGALDAADVVERHLASCPGRTARTGPPRVRLLRPIQPRELPWGLRQPWASARAAS